MSSQQPVDLRRCERCRLRPAMGIRGKHCVECFPEVQRENGKRGQAVFVERLGGPEAARPEMQRRGRLGGRPRNRTLAEIEAATVALRVVSGPVVTRFI